MRKAPGTGREDKVNNKEFVDFLMELSNYEKNVNRNTFKGNAYKKVCTKKSKFLIRIDANTYNSNFVCGIMNIHIF